MSNMEDTVSDEELCELAGRNERDAEQELVLRYAPVVRAHARPLFLIGGDSEDLVQEGMIGLLDAIREFDRDKNVQFRTFASRCIRNRLASAIKSASRLKHIPLSDYVSIETSRPESIINAQSQTPEDYVLGREAFLELFGFLTDLLSPLERKILGLYLQGLSYSEISVSLSKPVKSVDNAVQRIRRKIARQKFRR